MTVDRSQMTGKDDGKDKLGDMNFKPAVNCQPSSPHTIPGKYSFIMYLLTRSISKKEPRLNSRGFFLNEVQHHG